MKDKGEVAIYYHMSMDIFQRLKTYEPIFGEYKVVRMIGKGAFSEVYEVESVNGKENAAIKVIPLTSEDMRDLKKFEQEIEILKNIPKNNFILPLQNSAIIRQPYTDCIDILILTELCRGSLQNLITQKDYILDESAIVRIGFCICSALEIIHNLGIIHRDIKPENILISETGQYRLADFGVAKRIFADATSSSRSTPLFAAPEVIRLDKIDKRCDIYSTGIMLYMMLNNLRFPFEPENPTNSQIEEALGRRVRGEQIPPPNNVPKKFPQLVDIILKACAYERERRFENATQMKEAFLSLILIHKEKKREFNSENKKLNENFLRITERATPESFKNKQNFSRLTENIQEKNKKNKSAANSKKKGETKKKRKRSIYFLIIAAIMMVAVAVSGIIITNLFYTPDSDSEESNYGENVKKVDENIVSYFTNEKIE